MQSVRLCKSQIRGRGECLIGGAPLPPRCLIDAIFPLTRVSHWCYSCLMTKFSRLRKQGSSLILTLPKPLCAELGLLPGDSVLVTLRGARIVAQKVDPAELLRDRGPLELNDEAHDAC